MGHGVFVVPLTSIVSTFLVLVLFYSFEAWAHGLYEQLMVLAAAAITRQH